ncbi:hypothetical protein [Streptomyces sp. NPDC094468]|uniref:hypothetical protein n=1 Tax=Streptomyces sp. NPDC094468 TaxID=3366066 RepID=UPI003800F70A
MSQQETRPMLPEVQKYVTAVNSAVAAQRDATRAACEKFPDRHDLTSEGRAQYDAYSLEVRAAITAVEESRAAAWQDLKSSSDPLVKWIAEHCESFPDQANAVLTALPATVEELDALAKREGWCEVWDNFRDQAREAGVMPGVEPPSAARVAVFARIDAEGCCPMGPSSRRRIGIALDALVTEALVTATSAR